MFIHNCWPLKYLIFESMLNWFQGLDFAYCHDNFVLLYDVWNGIGFVIPAKYRACRSCWRLSWYSTLDTGWQLRWWKHQIADGGNPALLRLSPGWFTGDGIQGATPGLSCSRKVQGRSTAALNNRLNFSSKIFYCTNVQVGWTIKSNIHPTQLSQPCNCLPRDFSNQTSFTFALHFSRYLIIKQNNNIEHPHLNNEHP